MAGFAELIEQRFSFGFRSFIHPGQFLRITPIGVRDPTGADKPVNVGKFAGFLHQPRFYAELRQPIRAGRIR